jgi:hypothetical protein
MKSFTQDVGSRRIAGLSMTFNTMLRSKVDSFFHYLEKHLNNLRAEMSSAALLDSRTYTAELPLTSENLVLDSVFLAKCSPNGPYPSAQEFPPMRRPKFCNADDHSRCSPLAGQELLTFQMIQCNSQLASCSIARLIPRRHPSRACLPLVQRGRHSAVKDI